MTGTFEVVKETFTRWPGRPGKPAMERFELDLREGEPGGCLKGVVVYRCSAEDVANYWGKMEGKLIRVAIKGAVGGPRGAVLEGSVLGIVIAGGGLASEISQVGRSPAADGQCVRLEGEISSSGK
jgi:hypothetical protein